MTHRYPLSIFFAIWGKDVGGVTVPTDLANLVLTGQEVELLMEETGRKGQRSGYIQMSLVARGGND